MKQRAAFFDRDGTLIKDVSYLSSLEQIEFLPYSVELCLYLQKKGYLLFVVTNQSGIARGFFDEDFVQKTHRYLNNLFLERGIGITKFYYCPHHPEVCESSYQKQCDCRKPKPGMLLQAAKEYDIDLENSLMFGDKECDVQAGLAAGCKSFLIQDIFSKYKKTKTLKCYFDRKVADEK